METRKHTQLKCGSCLFVAKDEKRLGTHEKQHGYKGQFTCDACNYSHDDQKIIQSHMKRHHHGLVQLQSPTNMMSPDVTSETSDTSSVTDSSQMPADIIPDSGGEQKGDEISSPEKCDSEAVQTNTSSDAVAEDGPVSTDKTEPLKVNSEADEEITSDKNKPDKSDSPSVKPKESLVATDQAEAKDATETKTSKEVQPSTTDVPTNADTDSSSSALELLKAIASITGLVTEDSERGSEDNFSMKNSPNPVRPVVRSSSRDSMDRGNIFETMMSDIGNGSLSAMQKTTSSSDSSGTLSKPMATLNVTSEVKPVVNHEQIKNPTEKVFKTDIKDNHKDTSFTKLKNLHRNKRDTDSIIEDTKFEKVTLSDVIADKKTTCPNESASQPEKESELQAETNSSVSATNVPVTEEISKTDAEKTMEVEDENKDISGVLDFKDQTNNMETAVVPIKDVETEELKNDHSEKFESKCNDSEPKVEVGKEANVDSSETHKVLKDETKTGDADLSLRIIKAPAITNPFEILDDIKDEDMPIIEVVDPDAKKPRYKCAFCPQTIHHSKHHLFKHQRCHIRKNPYNCKTCNYGTNSLPHLRDHILIHDEEDRTPLPAAPAPRVKHRRSVEPGRTTRARYTEERRKSESAANLRNGDDEINGASECSMMNGEESVAENNTLPNESMEDSISIDGKCNNAEGKAEERDGAFLEKRGRGRPPGRRSSMKSTGRASPRSPGRCSPRSPGRSPARAPNTQNDASEDQVDPAEITNKVAMEVDNAECEYIDGEIGDSPTTSPRSRCRTRKISKTVAAELENNTAIAHEYDVVPAKRLRRRSTTAGMDGQSMEATEDSEQPARVQNTVQEGENASDAASLDMSHDDEDDDVNEDELDDVDQHIDTSSGDIAIDSVVSCKFCPFTVLAGDEKAQLNLRKHEQYHFRKSKYSCKHCTYSSGRLLVIKKHLDVLHADLSGLVIQKPTSTVKFTGKKIKMSFSFIKKNAFFKPLGLANRKALAVENEDKSMGPDSKAHYHHTRAGGKRVSPRAKATCPCCVPNGKGDGKRSHNCMLAAGSDDDKIDVGEETNENADLDSTLSPASKRIRMEDTKQETIVIYGDSGEKIGLKCHHCPFQLPWNHGVTSRMHAHEACHFRTSQFECTCCGWNCGNIIAAKKHMVIHPESKPTDLLKRWGKQFKGKAGATVVKKPGAIPGRRTMAASNLEIMKNLTQKARIIKANTLKNSGKYGNNTVGAILQRKRVETVDMKPSGKTIKEILNLKGESTRPNTFATRHMVSILSPTKDGAGSAKTVRALLDQSRSTPLAGMPNKPHITKVAPVTLPKSDGTHLHCQYCPFKVRTDGYESAKEMGLHVQCHFHNSRYTCNKCKFSVGIQSVFKKHLELHTDVDGESPTKSPESDKPDAVSCQYCPYSLRGVGCQATIKNHEKCHFRRGSFSCKACNYATNVKENWSKHVKCHRWSEEEGANNLVLSGGKQSPPSPRPSHSKPASSHNEKINTLKCEHCPFEIPVHYRASNLNMERHTACHTANEKFRCNYDGCTFSVGEEQVLEKHQRYHEPWFLKTLPQHWKQNMNQLQIRPSDGKAPKVELLDAPRANPTDHIDVSKYRNANGTINVEMYMKSSPILYVRHADNNHAVRCHFCAFQIALNRNATYGLFENQIRKHEICHFAVGKKKKNCNRCSFRTRSFDSFKAHIKVHSPEHERKMAAGVLLYHRPTRQEIVHKMSGDTNGGPEKMPENEVKELQLTNECVSTAIEPQTNYIMCKHCPFRVAPGESQSLHLANHEKRHFDTNGRYKCPKCKYGTQTQKLFSAHIALHPELQIVDTRNVQVTPKKKRMLKDSAPIHRCHTCEFTTSNGNLMYRHVGRHGPTEQKYSTTVVGSGDIALEYCGGCSYVTSVSGEIKVHLDECAGKVRLFKDAPNQDQNGQDDQSTDGEFSDDPGMQSPYGKSGVVDESLVWQCLYCDYKTFREYQLQCHVHHHSPSAKGKFRCDKCGFRAKRDKDYNVHLNFHHVSGVVSPVNQQQMMSPYTSQPGSEVATTPEVTPSPVKEQAAVPVYTPVKPTRGIVQRSLSSAFPGGTYDCEICDYSSTSEFHYMKHMLGHTDTSPKRRYRCSICGYGALKTMRLQQHMQFHHKSTGTVLTTEIETHRVDDPKYHYFNMGRQRVDKKRGGNVEGATLQRETHSSYVKVSNTNQHVLVVGNCTRYRCSKCDFVTDKKRMFKTHWYGHTCSKAARPEECPTCGYRTDTRYRLEFHMKKHHKVPGKARDESRQMAELQALVPQPKNQRNGRVSPRSSRPGSPCRAKNRPISLPSPTWRREPTFYCDKCPFFDTSKEAYEQHQQGHQLVEDFRCLYCTYSTKSRESLKVHIKVHFTVSHQQAALDQLEKELETLEATGAMPEITLNGDGPHSEPNVKQAEEAETNGQVLDRICPYCDITIQSDVYSNHVARHTQGSMYLNIKVNQLID